MNFPTCCGPVIENWALNNKFYVCTECKKEVTHDLPPVELDAPVSRQVWPANYPATPTPISVEEVKTLVFDFDNYPWIDYDSEGTTPTKEETDHGFED